MHILIANQHGENRGDEAAMRAMLQSFAQALPDTTFTLLYQFQDRGLRLTFDETVQDLPIVLPASDYIRALVYTGFKMTGLDLRSVLSPPMQTIVEAYARADLVVSAPGGPYFGDIYANHEIVHWWYVLLGYLFEKPLFLYAASAGPFENPWLNPIRKWLYRKFDVLVARESLSAEFIRKLLGADTQVEVTADAAIQASFPPYPRSDYFRNERALLAERFLIAVSLNDFRYPESDDPAERRLAYDAAMLETLEHLAKRVPAHFLFLPQLYGRVHSDEPYLRRMAERLPAGVSWEIVDPGLGSDMQRRLFAMSDLHIASRYHPAIFGHTAYVPGICIYYEHKALGFMQQLELERYAFDINRVRGADLCSGLDEILVNRESLVAHLKAKIPVIREAAARTTGLAIDLLNRASVKRSSRASRSAV